MYTIDELVGKTYATAVAVMNPRVKGVPTPGYTMVEKYEVEHDCGEVFLWVWIHA